MFLLATVVETSVSMESCPTIDSVAFEPVVKQHIMAGTRGRGSSYFMGPESERKKNRRGQRFNSLSCLPPSLPFFMPSFLRQENPWKLVDQPTWVLSGKQGDTVSHRVEGQAW